MHREILYLAIPNILSNISVPLLSTVDTALMGRLSEFHIGAVGVGSMIFNFIYWNFGFLRMGTTGMTAQAFGRKDEKLVGLNLGRPVFVAVVLAMIILLFNVPLGKLGILLMGAGEEVSPLIGTYFRIRIWAAPATLLLYVLMGWFFGLQNAIFPLLLTIFINIVNILCSYVFVFRLGWEIEGVAWGTVIAQYAGLLMALGLAVYRYPHLVRGLKLVEITQWRAFRVFLRVNRDIFLRTFMLTFAFGFFYAKSSIFGPELLAVNVILLQYVNWMSYAIDGFAFAAESVVGKYFGSGDKQKFFTSVRLSFLWALASALLVSAAYLLSGASLLRVFTDQQEVIASAGPYLFWMYLFPVVGFACYIWDGVFIGMTASVAMRNTMAIAFLVFLGAYALFVPLWQNHGLWMALLTFLGARGLFQWYVFSRKGIELA